MSDMISRPEDMDAAGLADYIAELYHRMTVHEGIWFREVEHQLGADRALRAMDYAWQRTRGSAQKRLAEYPNVHDRAALQDLPRERALSMLDTIAKVWLAQDGVWFQAVEFTEGMTTAKLCNDSAWGRFSPFEAHSIKNLLGMGDCPGLDGLERALAFRMYGRLNVQSCSREPDGSLIFRMENCRVQAARIRKGLDDYPCKSGGMIEYTRFASAIDPRIRTRCLACPPDDHPDDWFCSWHFCSVPEPAG